MRAVRVCCNHNLWFPINFHGSCVSAYNHVISKNLLSRLLNWFTIVGYICSYSTIMANEEAIKAMFAKFDKDNNGLITCAELEEVFKNIGGLLKKEELKEIIASVSL